MIREGLQTYQVMYIYSILISSEFPNIDIRCEFLHFLYEFQLLLRTKKLNLAFSFIDLELPIKEL